MDLTAAIATITADLLAVAVAYSTTNAHPAGAVSATDSTAAYTPTTSHYPSALPTSLRRDDHHHCHRPHSSVRRECLCSLHVPHDRRFLKRRRQHGRKW